MKFISSSDNPVFKHCLSLLKSKERRKQGKFLIEGEKEIEFALKAGYSILQLIVKEGSEAPEFVSKLNPHALLSFSETLFSKLVYRESVVNCLAVAETKFLELHQLKLKKHPLLLVLESVEKPGNLGAIIRTADAFAADAVIVCDPKVDFYNPNVLRSSVGTVFHVPLVYAAKEEVVSFLEKQNIKMFSTSEGASTMLHKATLDKGAAFVLGTEAEGLSSFWIENGAENLRIPMEGINDSLNVSVAAALMLYEAKRQRGF